MATVHLNYIDGRWCPAETGETFDSRNPANTDDVLGSFPSSGPADGRRAVEAVHAGAKDWANASPEQRANVLEQTAELMLGRTDALARELTREEGKTLTEATNEIKRTAANFRLYAGEALRIRGETFPTDGTQLVCTIRQPVGVVVAITPWNFPTAIPARKIGPALAAGNGVVFKPSHVTPLMGQRLVELLLEGGLPPRSIALVQGRGGAVGEALVSAPQTRAITFTGSYPVGQRIYHIAGPARKTQLEMGGKNPCIVLADADVDKAVAVITRGAYGLSGQACTSTSRVLVVGDVHDRLVEKLVEATAPIRVGDGLDDGVQMGPVANQAQLDKVLSYIKVGKSEGAKLLVGGAHLTDAGRDKGYFVSPAVFADVPDGGRLTAEEIFGPVVAVQRVNDLDTAIALANEVEYGLAASIVTRDVGRVLDFGSRIDAGVIKVNSPTTGVALTAPFGGIKHSSNQVYKEQTGAGVMDFYTTTKTLYLAG